MPIHQPAIKPSLDLDRLDRIARRLTAQFCRAGYKPSRLNMLLRRKDRLNRIRASMTAISPVGVCSCCGEPIYGPICEHYDNCLKFRASQLSLEVT